MRRSSMHAAMQRWNWRYAGYCVAMLSPVWMRWLFGTVGVLCVLAGCGAYVLWLVWAQKTRSGQTFRQAAAEVVRRDLDRRQRRQLFRVFTWLMLPLALLALPTAYYSGGTGLPLHWIYAGTAIVAALVFVGWRRKDRRARRTP